MKMAVNAETQALIATLVHITNNHKIYGVKSEISDTSYIADILLQSLETIHALRKERDDLINEFNSISR